MDAPNIDNRTEFVVQPHLLLDKDGEKLVLLVKGTFEQDGKGLCTAAVQREIRFADEPWGDPATTPPKYPCDACGYKAATDVVVVAKGHAPGGKPAETFDVAVRVGPLEKTLRIYGLRVWLEGGEGVSAPRPVTEQEIRYDFAWGGLDATNPARIVEEPRNPVGIGVTHDKQKLTHQRAPSIEDPAHPIALGGRPAGFGAIGPHWEPRRRYHGTVDERWHREQAPLLPVDRDDRANQCASPGLIASPPLKGGEQVSLLNLVPGGGLVQFHLPRVTPRVVLEGRNRIEREPHLDTVLIDTLQTKATVELVWRTVTAAPRRMKDLHVVVQARTW